MLRFFRQIRKSLFDQKRFSRYLLYALGEVVLVVIGILIALQLNNSNEVRKQQEFALASFEELQKEIYTNLRNVHYFMDETTTRMYKFAVCCAALLTNLNWRSIGTTRSPCLLMPPPPDLKPIN